MTDILPQELREAIVGCTLGDIIISKRAVKACLQFAQSKVHSQYLLYLYSLFEPYCSTPPRLHTAHVKTTGKDYQQLGFKLALYPSLMSSRPLLP
jgi:hypothetical protein